MKPFVEMTLTELLGFLQDPATKYQVEGQPWPLPLYTREGERVKYGGVHPEGCYVLAPYPLKWAQRVPVGERAKSCCLIWLQLIGPDGYKDKNSDQIPPRIQDFAQAELSESEVDDLVRQVIHDYARKRGNPIPPWPYPWPRPESHWDTDGPAPGQGAVEVVVHGTEFLIEPSGESGPHTGRGRFKVACRGCGKVLHHSTTGVTNRIESHRAENHPVGFVLRGVTQTYDAGPQNHRLEPLNMTGGPELALKVGDYFVFPEQPRVNRILRWEGVGKIPAPVLGAKGLPAILDDGYTVEDVVALAHPKLDELWMESDRRIKEARERANRPEPTSIPEPVLGDPHVARPPSRAKRSRSTPHQWSWETLERSYHAITTTLRWAHRVALCEVPHSTRLDVWIQSFLDEDTLVFVGALAIQDKHAAAFCDDQLLAEGDKDQCIEAMIKQRQEDWAGSLLAQYVKGLL